MATTDIHNFAAQRVSDNRILITWTNPTAYEAICVECSVDGGRFAEIHVQWEGAESFEWRYASANHTYVFRARTYYYGYYYAYTSNTPTIYTTPNPPKKIKLSRASTNNVLATLENPTKAATSLEWQASQDKQTWSSSTSVSGIVTSFTATGLSGIWYLRVRNVNSTGSSDWLVSDAVITICPPNPPTITAPRQNEVVSTANSNLVVSWTHNALDGSAQEAYVLAYSINGGAFTELTGTTAQSRSIAMSTFAVGDSVAIKCKTKGADDSYSEWSSTTTVAIQSPPTVSITSPAASVSGMPILLTATFSDTGTNTCIGAKVTLRQDSEVLYSEECSVSGNTISAQLDIDEFLPTIGETYTVVVDARSSSTLTTQASADFSADFTAPVEGSLSIQNDPETGYTALVVSFDNEDEGADAQSVSVSRINADGTLTTIFDRVASGTETVDRYAPLNTPYQYAVTTFGNVGNATTVYIDNKLSTGYFFAYVGDFIARAKWNPESGGNVISRPNKQRVFYPGREYPVSYDGVNISQVDSVSFQMLEKQEANKFEELMRKGGRGIYKSCVGDVFHADFDVVHTPLLTDRAIYSGISLTVTKIAGDKL